MKQITAAQAKPGDTIRTSGSEPVTLTVTGGGWTDVDEFGNWAEPVDPANPTHVYLDGEGRDETLLLPVAEVVSLLSSVQA